MKNWDLNRMERIGGVIGLVVGVCIAEVAAQVLVAAAQNSDGARIGPILTLTGLAWRPWSVILWQAAAGSFGCWIGASWGMRLARVWWRRQHRL